MLREAEAALSAAGKWAAEHPLVGFMVMGLLGGVVAVIRMYEKAGIPFTWPSFFARCAAKGLMGVFLAVGVFFAWRSMNFSPDWGYIVAGICGLGATDIIEALVLIFIEKLRRWSAPAGQHEER